MILLGAAGGDIAGSRFEFHNHRSKDFELFTDECFVTDDTVMTMAVAQAVTDTIEEMRACIADGEEYDLAAHLPQRTAERMQEFGRSYPEGGYGGRFSVWLQNPDPKPYNSFGNGSAMRVSACGWAGTSAAEVRKLATLVSEPTHNHPEGIKGAVATALAIWDARAGMKKEDIAEHMSQFYDLNFTLDGIRSSYRFNETCQGSVPQAIRAFLDADSYEDTLRNAISIGGDSDTIAAIAGSIAEAYFGIPEDIQKQIEAFIRRRDKGQLSAALADFNRLFETLE